MPSTKIRARLRITPLLVATCLTNLVAVASIYTTQAMMPMIREDLGSGPLARAMPGLTLLGYALGVGGMALASRSLVERGRFGAHALVLVAGLIAIATSTTDYAAALGCLVLGVGCSITQRLLMIATTTNGPARRSEVIGMVIACGLTGIVISRAWVVNIGAIYGWRTTMLGAAALAAAFATLACALTARREPTRARRPKTIAAVMRQHAGLRRACVQQACMFAAYNAGWAILPSLVATTSDARAVIAALGATSALAAGRASRHGNPAEVARIGMTATACAAAALALVGHGMAAIAAMAALDVGTQIALVANQTRAQSLEQDVGDRGRLAAAVTSTGFMGGALGALVANLLT